MLAGNLTHLYVLAFALVFGVIGVLFMLAAGRSKT